MYIDYDTNEAVILYTLTHMFKDTHIYYNREKGGFNQLMITQGDDV